MRRAAVWLAVALAGPAGCALCCEARPPAEEVLVVPPPCPCQDPGAWSAGPHESEEEERERAQTALLIKTMLDIIVFGLPLP